ncbi:chitobiase/beta-hexosaminidase C-terminal domain-containing protein [Methanolapillus millepedarum]|uniref:Ig-like domain-containing protein n=1 Tax=Methanolapillus millepedarum TaxID=3028296 RepID=A0AA96ZUR8_9EURY|nr:hypothetical protein MsAc7_01430 [Methanosarcinaceae archaeon Ac7]
MEKLIEKTTRNISKISFLLVFLLIFLLVLPTAMAANVEVTAASLNAGTAPFYQPEDTINVTGPTALNATGWATLMGLTQRYHLVLNDASEGPGDGYHGGNQYILSITGNGVTSVGSHEYLDFIALEYVSFPNAISLSDYSLGDCLNLWYAYLPSANSFDVGVFLDVPLEVISLGNKPASINNTSTNPSFSDSVLIFVPNITAAQTYNNNMSGFQTGSIVAIGSLQMGTITLNAGDDLELQTNCTLQIPGSGGTLQWTKGDVNLSGKTEAAYGKTYVQSSDAGTYICYITVGGNSFPIAKYNVIVNSLGTISTPTTTPSGNIINGATSITLSCLSPSDATIYWTTDGSDPSSSLTRFSGSSGSTVSVSPGTNLKAMAAKYGWDNSSTLSITYQQQLLVTASPEDISVMAGDPVTFNVTAVGHGTLTYQWTVDKGSGFVNVTTATVSGSSGFNSNQLSISSAAAGMDGWEFKAVVGDNNNPIASSTVSSNSAELTVVEPLNVSGTVSVASDTVTLSGKDVTVTLQEQNGSLWDDVSSVSVSAGSPGTYVFENKKVGGVPTELMNRSGTYRILFETDEYLCFVNRTGYSENYSETVDFGAGTTDTINAVAKNGKLTVSAVMDGNNAAISDFNYTVTDSASSPISGTLNVFVIESDGTYFANYQPTTGFTENLNLPADNQKTFSRTGASLSDLEQTVTLTLDPVTLTINVNQDAVNLGDRTYGLTLVRSGSTLTTGTLDTTTGQFVFDPSVWTGIGLAGTVLMTDDSVEYTLPVAPVSANFRYEYDRESSPVITSQSPVTVSNSNLISDAIVLKIGNETGGGSSGGTGNATIIGPNNGTNGTTITDGNDSGNNNTVTPEVPPMESEVVKKPFPWWILLLLLLLLILAAYAYKKWSDKKKQLNQK